MEEEILIFKKSRKKNITIVTFASIMIVLAFSIYSSAEETQDELLDVGFSGKFSSEKEYTNPTGEKKDGKLLRRTGEESIKDGSVYLNGGENGIDFKPRVSLGSDELDRSFIAETKFKPEEDQGNYNTLLSVGGNLYVRYTSADTIEYGFDVNNDGEWSSEKESVSAPAMDEDSTIAIAYTAEDSGAKMQVFMDGQELPAVSSEEGRPSISADIDSMVGFGNEVNPEGQDRGFNGSISKVVLTQFEGSFDESFLKTMVLSDIEQRLLMYGLGNLDESQYDISEDETADGDVEVHGGEITEPGKIRLNGKDSNITFKPSEILTEEEISEGSISEIVLNPNELENENVVMDLAGAISVRSSDDSVDILIDDEVEETIDLSEKLDTEDDTAHLSLVYEYLNDEEAAISLWLDKEQVGEDITLSEHPKINRSSIMFAGTDNKELGNSLNGDIYGASFASLEGEFSEKMFILHEGSCVVPDDLEPGQEIEIDSNECPAVLTEKASKVRPKPKQVTWQQYEQTAFIHYGMNTYHDIEWGDLDTDYDPDDFNPTDLDTDQWAKSLKDSGFELVMLTAKHHDGFTLYPSRYTDFSVANSSWEDGEGDVLREFVDSMRKYDLDVGVYLSPADHDAYKNNIFANDSKRKERNIPTFVEDDDREGDSDFPTFTLPGTDYGEFFMNQLYEVLTEYGDIDEIWFDGAQGNIPGDKEEKYDWDSYYDLINELQEDTVIANVGKDVRWVGNESGFARENEWSVVGTIEEENGSQSTYPASDSSDLGSRDALSDAVNNGIDYLSWWPAEVDVSIRDGWFYHDNEQPKSVEELRDIYYDSVARNSVLLLNVPPNKEGKLPEEDVNILKEWHHSIEQDFAINHTKEANITTENGAKGADPEAIRDEDYDTSWQAESTEPSSITFSFDKAVDLDRIVLQEDINEGQQVEAFAIDVMSDGEWEEIYSNETIGYKRIVSLPDTVSGEQFRLRILKARDAVHLSEIGLYQTSDEDEIPVSNVSDLMELVDQLETNGEFSKDSDVAKALNLHLTAVKQFEETDKDDKVIKHLKSFISLLDYHKEEEQMSNKAYDQLLSGAEKLIDN